MQRTIRSLNSYSLAILAGNKKHTAATGALLKQAAIFHPINNYKLNISHHSGQNLSSKPLEQFLKICRRFSAKNCNETVQY